MTQVTLKIIRMGAQRVALHVILMKQTGMSLQKDKPVMAIPVMHMLAQLDSRVFQLDLWALSLAKSVDSHPNKLDDVSNSDTLIN